eukprot:scaffold176730_cov28-Tisochrysis_lutea.AAC.1
MRSEAQPRLHSLPRRHLRLDGVTLSVGAAPTRGKGGRTPRGDRLSQRDTNGARVCRSWPGARTRACTIAGISSSPHRLLTAPRRAASASASARAAQASSSFLSAAAAALNRSPRTRRQKASQRESNRRKLACRLPPASASSARRRRVLARASVQRAVRGPPRERCQLRQQAEATERPPHERTLPPLKHPTDEAAVRRAHRQLARRTAAHRAKRAAEPDGGRAALHRAHRRPTAPLGAQVRVAPCAEAAAQVIFERDREGAVLACHLVALGLQGSESLLSLAGRPSRVRERFALGEPHGSLPAQEDAEERPRYPSGDPRAPALESSHLLEPAHLLALE